MNFIDMINIFGGLALFLYGMQMMSTGLENVAGNQMKVILEKLTTNRFLGVFTGLVITAVIQSSSATTVMVMGFVNAEIMTLQQAVWIIMGANIGTTITGQLIALDVGKIAPLLAFIGVAVVMFAKQTKKQQIGKILAGLGILFIGMNLMSDSLTPLKDSPVFQSLLTNFKSPVVGILAGALFTAAIQSSSASVGVLQILAATGLIPFSQAVFVLFGQNIGTCITALIASIGASRNAKRTTIIHFTFNIIGTILFTTICILTPLAPALASLTPDNTAAQIANMHTLFNVVTTLLLLPFGSLFPTLANRILPDWTENVSAPFPGNADSGILGSSAVSLNQTCNEILTMFQLARQNTFHSFQNFENSSNDNRESILQAEDQLDEINLHLSEYISHAMVGEMGEKESHEFNAYYTITGNIERIGDHAVNLSDYSEKLHKKDLQFSDTEREEIAYMWNRIEAMMDYFEPTGIPTEQLQDIEALEQEIDNLEKTNRKHMMKRLKKGQCSADIGVLYSEMLTDFERIGDCMLNILQELASISIVK